MGKENVSILRLVAEMAAVAIISSALIVTFFVIDFRINYGG